MTTPTTSHTTHWDPYTPEELSALFDWWFGRTKKLPTFIMTTGRWIETVRALQDRLSQSSVHVPAIVPPDLHLPYRLDVSSQQGTSVPVDGNGRPINPSTTS